MLKAAAVSTPVLLVRREHQLEIDEPGGELFLDRAASAVSSCGPASSLRTAETPPSGQVTGAGGAGEWWQRLSKPTPKGRKGQASERAQVSPTMPVPTPRAGGRKQSKSAREMRSV